MDKKYSLKNGTRTTGPSIIVCITSSQNELNIWLKYITLKPFIYTRICTCTKAS